ncbi:MAG: FHA domain-containing protein [Desulfocucumaceae bacterium]
MIDLVLTIFRYIFLIILYIFIFQLIRMIFKDLKVGGRLALPRGKTVPVKEPVDISTLNISPVPGAAAGLVVLGSGDPGLPGGSVFPLKMQDEISMGRGSRNTITMVGPFASMDHAIVRGRDGQYWLDDLGSKNGTFLNEIGIGKPTVLADGDSIRIGDVTMQFVRWSYEVESGDRGGSRKETKRG